MTLDMVTMAVGFLSFVVFLIVHIITFRWVRPEHLLKSLLVAVVGMLSFPVVLMGILFVLKIVQAPLGAWILAVLLACVLQGLLCFVYVLCLFGPYETSVRMRLVREIALAESQGISLDELLARYNARTIVDIRLQRLLGSGDIIENNGQYTMIHRRNFFFIFDAIAQLLKKWIHS